LLRRKHWSPRDHHSSIAALAQSRGNRGPLLRLILQRDPEQGTGIPGLADQAGRLGQPSRKRLESAALLYIVGYHATV
jgi:hypothetical protein